MQLEAASMLDRGLEGSRDPLVSVDLPLMKKQSNKVKQLQRQMKKFVVASKK